MTAIEKQFLIAVREKYHNNHGQQAEFAYRFNMTGIECSADNVPHTKGGDYEDIQIKSSRATVCKGTDIQAYLATDGAKRYAYVNADFTIAYVMSREVYVEFVDRFGSVTTDSKKNGGSSKIRLKAENGKMIEWLESRAE